MTIHPQDYIRIDMACNNPSNGNFVGGVCKIELPGDMLDLTAKNWDIISSRGCPKFRESSSFITLSGKKWQVARSINWYGNWCWNAYYFDTEIAIKFLIWLHGRAMFQNEGGWCDFCDVWDAPAPLKIDEAWRVHLINESKKVDRPTLPLALAPAPSRTVRSDVPRLGAG